MLDALANRDHTPVRKGDRELKPQLYPDQIASLLGIPLSTGGVADLTLFPTIDPTRGPELVDEGRILGADDTFSGREEDRYPNVFNLRRAEPEQVREIVFAALNTLPTHAATLGHDIATNTKVLAKLA